MAQGLLSPDDMMMSYQQDNRNLLGMPLDEGSRGMLLPLGRVNEQRTLAVPQFALDMYRGFTAPARAYRGQITDPTEEAFNLASNLTGQGLIANIPARMAAQRSGQTMLGSAGGVSSVSGGQIRAPETDELGFYSQALETARNLMQPKGTGEQYRQMLLKGGVKPDEIRFTPELEGLLSQPKITRDELVGLLEANRIRPQETVLYGGDTPEFEGMGFPAQAEQLDIYEAFGRDYVDEEIEMLKTDFPEEVADAFRRYNPSVTQEQMAKVEVALDNNDIDSLVDENSELFIDNDFMGDVLLAIDEAAEELAVERYEFDPALRLQDPDTGYEIVGSDDMGYTIKDDGGNIINTDFVGSLSEARIQAETDAIDRGLIGYGGGDTRFMEYTEDGGTNYREMLLQVPDYQGQETGFTYSGHFDEPNIAVHARTKDRNSGTGINDVLYAEEIQSDWGQQGRRRGFMTGETRGRYKEIERELKPLQDDIIKLSRERDDLVEMLAEDMVEFNTPKGFFNPLDPDFEYKVSRGSIYRVMDDGSEVLVQGRSQVENQYLPDSQYNKDYQEITSEIAEINANATPLRQELKDLPSGAEVAPFVGSSDKFAELAVKRLINQAAKEGKRFVSFSPADVQLNRWGEEGLETFYDKILPKAAKKVAKKLDKDAIVDYMPIEGVDDVGGNFGTNRLTIAITPKMKEEALRGQPLFSGGLPVPASSLLGQEENNNRKIPAGLLDT